jgi:hypothetical protein
MPGYPETVFAVNLTVASPVILFAGLLITVALVIWLWLGLRGLAAKLRAMALVLRTLTMLLLVLLVADFAVSYQKANAIQVLVAVNSPIDVTPDRTAKLTSAKGRVTDTFSRSNILALEDGAYRSDDAAQSRPAAALLLTDGGLDPNAARSAISELQRGMGEGPVFVVTDLDESAAPRVTINFAALTGPVYRDTPFNVTARVQAVGMAGRKTSVTVADRAGVRSTEKIAWTSDDETRTLELEVIPKVAGWQDYRVSAEPAASGQPTSERQLAARVDERQWRVLMLEGEPTSESSFIRRSLDQGGFISVDYFAQVSRDAATGNRPADPSERSNGGGTGAGSPIARLHAVLADPARLNQYDCVIVGPTPNEMLSAAETERLRQWVERRGGGLVVLGGNNFAGSIIAPNGRLTSMMPAAIESGSFASPSSVAGQGHPVEAGESASFALVPTSTGLTGPLRGFAKARDAENDRRDVLGVGLKLGTVGPAAFVLAVSGDAQSSSSDTGTALIAAQPMGAGRVVLFAPADSFKLKVSGSDTSPGGVGPFDALWRGLALWSAQGAGPASELVLSTGSPAAGERVNIEARVREANFASVSVAKCLASWQALDQATGAATGPARPIEFLPDPNGTGIWRGELIAPEPGRYVIMGTATSTTGVLQKLEQRFTVVPAAPVEPGAARDTLDRLTRETGGKVFTLRNLDQLVAQLKAMPREPATITATWRLRQVWPLAFIIPLLLAGEWLILRLKL